MKKSVWTRWGLLRIARSPIRQNPLSVKYSVWAGLSGCFHSGGKVVWKTSRLAESCQEWRFFAARLTRGQCLRMREITFGNAGYLPFLISLTLNHMYEELWRSWDKIKRTITFFIELTKLYKRSIVFITISLLFVFDVNFEFLFFVLNHVRGIFFEYTGCPG